MPHRGPMVGESPTTSFLRGAETRPASTDSPGPPRFGAVSCRFPCWHTTCERAGWSVATGCVAAGRAVCWSPMPARDATPSSASRSWRLSLFAEGVTRNRSTASRYAKTNVRRHFWRVRLTRLSCQPATCHANALWAVLSDPGCPMVLSYRPRPAGPGESPGETNHGRCVGVDCRTVGGAATPPCTGCCCWVIARWSAESCGEDTSGESVRFADLVLMSVVSSRPSLVELQPPAAAVSRFWASERPGTRIPGLSSKTDKGLDHRRLSL